MTVVELLTQIARRDHTRSEAMIQADIRQLVLTAPLSLSAENVVTADLETPVGVRRRIDIEVGICLIEVKRDLSPGSRRSATSPVPWSARRPDRLPCPRSGRAGDRGARGRSQAGLMHLCPKRQRPLAWDLHPGERPFC
jgi:hypothetical protein